MSDSHAAPPTVERTLGLGAMAAGIAVACIIPPVIHFVSGPLGPLIGGVVAGTRLRAGGWHVLAIGGTTGLALAIAVVVLAQVAGALLPGEVSVGASALIGAAALVYGTIMASVGAWLGVWLERHGRREAPPPS